MQAALLQLISSDDPGENLATVRARMAEAAAGGAQFVLTPEVTNCVSTSRSHQRAVLHHELHRAQAVAPANHPADLRITVGGVDRGDDVLVPRNDLGWRGEGPPDTQPRGFDDGGHRRSDHVDRRPELTAQAC